MQTHGNPEVFLIIIPVFAALGIYLYLYGRKKSKMLKNFASSRGLMYQKSDNGKLEEELSQTLRLKTPYARSFFKVRDIVSDGEVSLFRVTELLDLNPYGTAQNPHSARIAVTFNTVLESNLFFMAKNMDNFINLFPGSKKEPLETNPDFDKLKNIIIQNPTAHPLTITVMNGKFLAYLEPFRTGSEKESDIGYLFDLAKKIKVQS